MTSTDTDDRTARRARVLRLHMFAFFGAAVLLLATDFLFFEMRWAHWPAMIWGAAFCVHALYCKSLSVDDDWADERAGKLRERSYDLGHILKIEESYKNESAREGAAAEKRD